MVHTYNRAPRKTVLSCFVQPSLESSIRAWYWRLVSSESLQPTLGISPHSPTFPYIPLHSPTFPYISPKAVIHQSLKEHWHASTNDLTVQIFQKTSLVSRTWFLLLYPQYKQLEQFEVGYFHYDPLLRAQMSSIVCVEIKALNCMHHISTRKDASKRDGVRYTVRLVPNLC